MAYVVIFWFLTRTFTYVQGICYREKVGGICGLGSIKKMAKAVCCCVIDGAAHGPACASCPAKGTGIYQQNTCHFTSIAKDKFF